ncbi:hypothetical protein QTJ16_003185 [Diplocarpon rosae]|uniref:Uncharacterized protein n=1 Tax=Diplocarpon rosae TaxID=946125 RepID=A0AAD9T272_9HELO|nr:hypothetical protein QTJ16_003185 [Diplocarpon rosae]
MAQGGHPTSTIDVLQSMINGILIETGKALRPSKKDGSKSLDAVNTRLKATIPSMAEHFHEALDDLESDIVRAKAVLLRDLEILRAKRIVLEDPVPVVQDVKSENGVNGEVEDSNDGKIAANGNELSPMGTVKQEGRGESPETQTPFEPPRPVAVMISQPVEDVKIPDDEPTSPAPAPLHEQGAGSKPIEPSVDIQSATVGSVAEPQNSSVDSLFDNPGSGDTEGPDLHFDDMDLSNLGAKSQTENTSQSQSNEFDLSGFNVPDLGTSTQTNTNPLTESEQENISAMVSTSDGKNMDIDMDMAGAEESVFDDMFFGDADDTGIGGGGEMQHGDFDNAFFGLD